MNSIYYDDVNTYDINVFDKLLGDLLVNPMFVDDGHEMDIATSFLTKFQNEVMGTSDGCNATLISLKWSGHLLMVSGIGLFSKNATGNVFTSTGYAILSTILIAGPMKCSVEYFMEYLSSQNLTSSFECISSVHAVGEHGNRAKVDTLILTAVTRNGISVGWLEMIKLANEFGLPYNQIWYVPADTTCDLKQLNNNRGVNYSEFVELISTLQGVKVLTQPAFTHSDFVGPCLEGIVAMKVEENASYFQSVQAEATLTEKLIQEQKVVYDALEKLTLETSRDIGYPDRPQIFKNKKRVSDKIHVQRLLEKLARVSPTFSGLSKYARFVTLLFIQHVVTNKWYVQLHIHNDIVFVDLPHILRGQVSGPLNPTSLEDMYDPSIITSLDVPKVITIFKFKLWLYTMMTFGCRNNLPYLVGTMKEPIVVNTQTICIFMHHVKLFTHHKGWALNEASGDEHYTKMLQFARWVKRNPDTWNLLRKMQYLDILEAFEQFPLEEEITDPLEDECAIILVTGKKGDKLKKIIPGIHKSMCPLSNALSFPVFTVAMAPVMDATPTERKLFEKALSSGAVCILKDTKDDVITDGVPVFYTIEKVLEYIRPLACEQLDVFAQKKIQQDAIDANVILVIPVGMPPGSGKSTILQSLLAYFAGTSTMVSSDAYRTSLEFNNKVHNEIVIAKKFCNKHLGVKRYILFDKNIPDAAGLRALMKNVIKSLHSNISVHWFTLVEMPNLEDLVERIMQRKLNLALPRTMTPKADFGEKEIRECIRDIFYEPSVNFLKENASSASRVETAMDVIELLKPDADGNIKMAPVSIHSLTPPVQYYAYSPKNLEEVTSIVNPILEKYAPYLNPTLNPHITLSHRCSREWYVDSIHYHSRLGSMIKVITTTLVFDKFAAALFIPTVIRPDGAAAHYTIGLLDSSEAKPAIYAGTGLLENPEAQHVEMVLDLGDKWTICKF